MSWAKTAAALGLLFMACSPAEETWLEPAQERAAAGLDPPPTLATEWALVAPMHQAVSGHAATLLNSGKVLISGTGSGSTINAEVYDPATNTWIPTAAMFTPHLFHTATLLPDGKVLIAGGELSTGSFLSSAEMYDPATNTWAPAGSMRARYSGHTATLLNNGTVLISGGLSYFGSPSLSAEVYDPATNIWAPTNSMRLRRNLHTATLLNNGTVLISGGYSGTDPEQSAEVYDPATRTWTPTSSMGSARAGHMATLLANGKVLITGGVSSLGVPVESAEVYDPATNTWAAAASMLFPRRSHTATLRPDGKVLIVGGYTGSTTLPFTDIYNPATDTWTPASSMGAPRQGHTATQLTNGKVLVAGGDDDKGSLASVELTTGDTSITAAPASPTNRTTAAFSFTADEPGATFECSLDNATFSLCSSPANYAFVAEGLHTFQVRARDEAGNVDPTPATWSWTVDLTPPHASFLQTPPNPTHQTHATFSFSTDDLGASFECSLDERSLGSCQPWGVITLSGLPEGPHTFRVLAHDALGNADPTPAAHSWTVDLTAPGTNVTETPPDPSNQSTATFHFTATEDEATFECSLDDGDFSPCSSPRTYDSLLEGPHTFQVQARDLAGNADPTPATFSWTLDLTGPETSILATPPNPTNQTTASFAFSSPETGATFECSLDEAPFSPCTSPVAFSPLALGAHTFRVRARDALGNVDSSPARHSWMIDQTAPETRINAAPLNPNNQTTATFLFTSTEAGSSFECSLDSLEEASFSPCSSPMTYAPLAEGPHAFRVQARDAAGNLDSSPATYSWTIDLTPVETQLTSAPGGFSTQATATFSFTSETEASFECSLDEAPFSPCGSPMNYSSLSEGPHTFRVRASDASGNVDETPEQRTWRVDTVLPETSFASTPELETRLRVPSFSFSSSEPRSTFECSLDGSPFSDCPKLFPSLEDGPHGLDVRARDEAGNLDPTPARYDWKVDNLAPEPPSLHTPSAGQELFTVTPLISGTAEPHSTVTLLIDGTEADAFQTDEQGLWSGVPSSTLSWGEHRLSAKASDRAGNSSALLPEVSFSSVRRGYYGANCTASPSTWQASWPWALLLLALLRPRAAR